MGALFSKPKLPEPSVVQPQKAAAEQGEMAAAAERLRKLRAYGMSDTILAKGGAGPVQRKTLLGE